MSSLFGSPSPPKTQPPPTPPTEDDKAAQDAAAKERAQLRLRRGRQSTVLTDQTGAGATAAGNPTGGYAGGKTVLGG